MSQINELEGRITAALDRIGTSVEALAAPVAEDTTTKDALAAAEAALAEERLANAQLEERVKSLGDKQAGTIAALEAELSVLRDGTSVMEDALGDMRAAHARLEETSHALRTAAEHGAADADQINAALQAELDALRAARAADVAEAAAILGALEPMIEQSAKEEAS